MSSTQILKLMKEKEIEYVDLRFTDPRGKLQHVTMDATVVDGEMLEEGSVCGSSSDFFHFFARNMDNTLGPCVLFFAGGGTNAATANYSAYTISKIALIKMCELLDAEIPDVRFTIVGPGWVRTKIHQATLEAGERAGDNYEKTNFLLNNDESTPMKYVLDCCDWLINSPREVVSGRNFSTVFDKWDTKELSEKLMSDSDMYKLRRYGNEFLIK